MKKRSDLADEISATSTKPESSSTNSFALEQEFFNNLAQSGSISESISLIDRSEMKEILKKMTAVKTQKVQNSSSKKKTSLTSKIETDQALSEKELAFKKFLLENQDYLLEVFESKKGGKKRKIRQSAHYIEQKLKYEKPSKQQISLFDILSPETQEKIKHESVSFIGIKLSPPEDRLMNAISRLLAKKSQTKDHQAEDFFMGNEAHRMVPYGQVKQKSAVLRFKKHELLTEFFGNKNYSGADIKYLDRIFNSFLEKKWLIRYKRTIQEDGKEKNPKEERHYVIEDYLPLLRVLRYFPNLSKSEVSKVEGQDDEFRATKGEYLLSLNPILTDQINSKYVEFPEDIDYRTRIAAGSHLAVSEAILRLRDWLISEMSANRYKTEINEDNLIHRLHLEKHIKSRKKERLYQQLIKAIQICQNLGIILDYEEAEGAAGQKKYIFRLNKDFE